MHLGKYRGQWHVVHLDPGSTEARIQVYNMPLPTSTYPDTWNLAYVRSMSGLVRARSMSVGDYVGTGRHKCNFEARG